MYSQSAVSKITAIHSRISKEIQSITLQTTLSSGASRFACISSSAVAPEYPHPALRIHILEVHDAYLRINEWMFF